MIILTGSAGALVYLVFGLNEVSFEDFEVKSIKEISSGSITITADLLLHNPSGISVPVREVRYTIYNTKTKAEVSTGIIPAFELARKTTSRIPFEQQIKFLPTASLASAMVTDEKVYVVVKGEVFLDISGARKKAIPFEKKIEIKQYVNVPFPSTRESLNDDGTRSSTADSSVVERLLE